MQQKPSQEELFAAVDELLAGEPELPAPDERGRLREAAGVSQARLAQVLRTTKQTVKNWESGRSEPRPPQRQAYLRLLEGWAAKYPAESATESEQQRLPSQPVGQAPPAEPIVQAPTAEPVRQAPSIEPIVQAPSAEPVRRALSPEPVREPQPVRQPA
ncbi:helix-turn-helix domain-containing protein, partial [Streptomyces caniscabiei]